tara:strand:- start:212 stop:883 length:672 start_codon:yes stop_codon:yes gene_type:complete
MSDDLEGMTVAELKDLLREKGLPLSGNKSALIDRLRDDEGIEEPVDEEVPSDEIDEDDFDSGDEGDDDFEFDEEEDDEWDEEEEFHVAKQKPVLSEIVTSALEMRASQKKSQPKFRRSEWFRYKRLSKSGWRRPKGMQNKQRMNLKYRGSRVRIGHGKVSSVRGLHSSGFKEIMVFNTNDLENIDPEKEAARVGRTVGSRKRELIHERADELGIRILNRRRNV